MLDIHFRPCLSSDIDTVQQFVNDLFKSYPPEEGLSPNIARTFSEFARCPDKGSVIVFDYGQQIVGYAVLVWIWTNEFSNHVLWIDEIVVHEKYRGLGIGKRFFSWIASTYPHCPALSLLVAQDNHGAKKLYEEIGFKPLQLQMMAKVNQIAKSLTDVPTERTLVEAA